jgi:hypothetical protein
MMVQAKGGDSLEASEARHGLATSLALNGEWKESQQIWKDEVACCLERRGAKSSRTLNAQACLAVALWFNRRDTEAIELLQRVIKTQEHKFGPKARALRTYRDLLARLEEERRPI